METTMTTQPNQSRKGGRPRLLPEEQRKHKFKIGYTAAQYEKLVERAEAAGLTEIELIRRLSLELEIKTIPVANREAIIELNRIGRNINKVAHKLLAGAVQGTSPEHVQQWMDIVSRGLAEAGKQLVQHDQ